MHGNVWEYCDDRLPDLNGVPQRVTRGGAFNRGADHSTATFRQTRAASDAYWGNGLRVARVRARPAPFTAEQRAALEWVLSHGGRLQLIVDDKPRTYVYGEELPQVPFKVNVVNLSSTRAIDDVSIENLRAMPNVEWVLFLGPPVGDSVLAKVASYPGLAHASAVNFHQSAIGDEGLVHLKKFRRLNDVNLDRTHVTAKGAAQLVELNLTHVSLQDCQQIGDDAVDALANLPTLQYLYLDGSPVTDDGLASLSRCEQLSQLRVRRCRVTEAGVKKLAAANPRLRIHWDGGVIERRATTPSGSSN